MTCFAIDTDVSFVRPEYTFGEGDGTGQIAVILRGTIETEVTAVVFEIGGWEVACL